MQSVHSGTISVDQYSSSSGTVWKSSSSSSRSEGSGELVLDLLGVSKLSLLKDRRRLTSFSGECVWVLVTGLCGMLCAGLKDACSKLHTYCMHGVVRKGVGTSSLEPLS